MTVRDTPLQRRDFLRGTLAAAVLIPLGGALASCAGSGGGSKASTGDKGSTTNPFGMAATGTVDAYIFNGGYGIDYAKFAASVLHDHHSDTSVKVTGSTTIAQTLQPRFVGGTPPDVIDNSGVGNISFSTVLGQLEDLSDVIDTKNYEGKVIKDTLYSGVLKPGTFNGKLAAINYVLTVFALWHSAALFEENGWSVPKTWDGLLDLGAQAKAKGKYLFGWGKEAANYYLTLVMGSAIKEGGDDVRLALDNLKPGCWSLAPVQDVLKGLKKIIDAGYVKPGGAGTQFTAAQAQWSQDEQFVLYPSGGWIENEMKKATKAGFRMTGAPEPVVSDHPAMPYTALHSTSTEAYMVPSQGKNAAGGKEFMRAMLSKDAAANFAKTILSSTVVKGTVPEDGFGSTALVSQVKLLDGAGSDVFTWGFVDTYGLNTDLLVQMNTFLQGGSDVATLTAGLQAITDKTRKDPSVKKITVT